MPVRDLPTGIILQNADGTQVAVPNVPGNVQTLGGWFDVTAYGAKGDGTTDDTAAFIAALAAADAAKGGTVFVPKGKYKVTSTLTIPRQTILRGAGGRGYSNLTVIPGASVIECHHTGACISVGNFGASNTSVYNGIRDLTIRCNVDQYSAFIESPKTITGAVAGNGGWMKFSCTAHGYTNDDQVTIAGVGDSTLGTAANKTWRSVRSSYTILTTTNSSGVVKVKTDRAHRLNTGELVVIAGNSISGYNGTWTVTAPSSHAVSGCADNGSGIVRVTATGHGFSTGDQVETRGIYGTGGMIWWANGVFTITVVDADNFDLQGTHFITGASYRNGGTSGSFGVVSPTTFTLDTSTYTSDGTGGTASQADKFTVDDNLDINNVASGTLQNADFVGSFTTNGTAKKFLQATFNSSAGCAIEAIGATDWNVRNVALFDFPVGVIYDNAELGSIEDIIIGGLQQGTHYSDFLNTSVGIWSCDRGSYGGCNSLSVRNMQAGGAYNVRVDGGDLHKFEKISCEGGRKGFDVLGSNTLTIKKCFMEGIEEYGFHFKDLSYGTTIEDCLISNVTWSRGPVLKSDTGMIYARLLGNAFYGLPYTSVVTGTTNFVNLTSLGNRAIGEGVTMYDGNPGGASICQDDDADQLRLGLGISIGKPLASLHARLTNTAYPAVRLDDGNGKRHTLELPSAKKAICRTPLIEYGSNSGPVSATEHLTTTPASGTTNGAGYLPPGQGSFTAVGKVFFEVTVMKFTNTSNYARWMRSQWVKVSAGTITLVGSPADEQTPEDTDGGYAANPPILVQSGGQLYVQVTAHASTSSSWNIRTDCNWTED
jgi:hypothetical protein